MPHTSELEKVVASLPSNNHLAALTAAMPHASALEKFMVSLPSNNHLAGLAVAMPHTSALEKVMADLPSQRSFAATLGAFDEIDRVFRKYNERFYLPTASTITSLSNQFFAGEISANWKKYIGAPDALHDVLMSMAHSWADAQDSIRSVSGLAELQTLHGALAGHDPFGHDVCHTWRSNLGDWRDPITLTPQIADNFLSRLNLYTDLGLNEKLTDFPVPAFAEALEITKIRSEPVTLLTMYGPPIAASDSEEEESAFVRTNMAHDWLQRLESQLRRFIDDLMTNEFGSDWPRRNLPTGIYEDWEQKKSRAEKDGMVSRPLIAYADFTHYELIICRRQNWRVFANIFHKEESIRESLQRLYLPRIATMHARPLAPEDELLLYAEIKRLARALRRKT